MALRRTHYDVLGVARDASSVDIASAFRDKLAEAKGRADVAPEYMDSLREAYQTLANPARRDEYDATLAPRVPVRSAKPAPAGAVAEGDSGAAWRARLVKFGVPIAIVVVSFWGWKSRKPPEAQVASPSAIVPARTAAPSGDAPGSRAAVPAVPAARAPASTPAAAKSAEQVFAEVSGSIVRVLVSDSGGRLLHQGSGVVTGAGRVITNCHVARGGPQVTVKTGTESRPAAISIADEELDLCSLNVSALDANAVAIGSVANLRTGQRVYAIGAPHGLELTISEGIVSSLREVPQGGKIIQTTAPVSQGSSGGGLFSADGQLVGIVTFQHRFGQNLNFAVPADYIGEMRARGTATVQVAASTAEPSTAELVAGKWWCFGSISGRNGEYTYGPNGMLLIAFGDGRNVAGPYQVSGRRIRYQVTEGTLTLEIESLSRDRMVLLVGEGHRLACERRS